ncbi:unnamed protein product [Amaranthus hypochondriacus]
MASNSRRISAIEVEIVTQPSETREGFEFPSCGDHDNGMFLTWQDLCVTVSDKESGDTKRIIEDAAGYASPGQVLAIMGPSGSGKSTLLDALAGRLNLSTKQSGLMLINGCKQAPAHGTLAYVTQDDTLMTTLTVRETMYYSSELLLPPSMPKIEKQKRAENCIKEMGLQEAMDTRVGGWGVKGLSGGEKRRLSLCIEILPHPKLLLLDEPTSGLDSAASFHVMSRIASKERIIGRTIVASIHQPSSQVFELFDNLCLLSAGRTVYFGPAQQANKFFASNGFPCPPLQNPPDHFLQMTNKDFDQDIEQGLSTRKSTEDNIKILLNSYKSSHNYQQVESVINEICKKKHKELEIRKRASFLGQCQVLTRRSFVNMCRDWGYYWLRLVVYIILGLSLGTLYLHLGYSFRLIHARVSLLVFVTSFLTIMAIGGFPSFVEDMKVFKHESLNGHYGTGSFVVGNTLSSTPFLFLLAIIPGSMAYYMPGLKQGFEYFSYFTLTLFTCMLLVESLMMIVASLVPNFLLGVISGAGLQGLMLLGGGYFQLPQDLPTIFWRYPLYYISFHKYAFQGLFKNEFLGLKFSSNGGFSSNILDISSNMMNGVEILEDILQVETRYSKWVDLFVLLGMVIIYRLLFLIIIKTLEKIKNVMR